MSRITGVKDENRENVTKSLKITQKIEISAYTVACAMAFARAAIVGSGTNSAISRLHLSSLHSTVSGFWPNCYTTLRPHWAAGCSIQVQFPQNLGVGIAVVYAAINAAIKSTGTRHGGGQMPNSPYIRAETLAYQCNNPHGAAGPYFYRFPTQASPTLPVPASQLTAPLTGANVANPSAALKPRCKSQKPCGSGRIDAACSHNMCQQHCIEIGDCALRLHQRKHDQMLGTPTPTPRARKSQPAPPAPLRLPFTDYDSHDDWTSKTLPGIRALDNYTPPIDPVHAQQLPHVNALTAMAGIKSPSPDSVEDEDVQLALGIRMSLAQFNSTSGAGPSRLDSPPRAALRLRLPSTILQAGCRSPPFYQTQCSPSALFSRNQDDYPMNYPPPVRLRSLSSSPVFPSSIPLPTSESQIKSKPKKTASEKAAPLTVQLNNDWISLGLQSSETPPTLH
ncbi:hypothetical protein DFH08DRAFT_819570, partial [Mycena albidolilacea]